MGSFYFTIPATAISLFYVAGLLTLTMRRWAATLALVLLCVDILGRIARVAAGLYPVDTARNVFAMIAGTAIAALIGLYIWRKRKSFR